MKLVIVSIIFFLNSHECMNFLPRNKGNTVTVTEIACLQEDAYTIDLGSWENGSLCKLLNTLSIFSHVFTDELNQLYIPSQSFHQDDRLTRFIDSLKDIKDENPHKVELETSTKLNLVLEKCKELLEFFKYIIPEWKHGDIQRLVFYRLSLWLQYYFYDSMVHKNQLIHDAFSSFNEIYEPLIKYGRLNQNVIMMDNFEYNYGEITTAQGLKQFWDHEMELIVRIQNAEPILNRYSSINLGHPHMAVQGSLLHLQCTMIIFSEVFNKRLLNPDVIREKEIDHHLDELRRFYSPNSLETQLDLTNKELLFLMEKCAKLLVAYLRINFENRSFFDIEYAWYVTDWLQSHVGYYTIPLIEYGNLKKTSVIGLVTSLINNFGLIMIERRNNEQDIRRLLCLAEEVRSFKDCRKDDLNTIKQLETCRKSFYQALEYVAKVASLGYIFDVLKPFLTIVAEENRKRHAGESLSKSDMQLHRLELIKLAINLKEKYRFDANKINAISDLIEVQRETILDLFFEKIIVEKIFGIYFERPYYPEIYNNLFNGVITTVDYEKSTKLSKEVLKHLIFYFPEMRPEKQESNVEKPFEPPREERTYSLNSYQLHYDYPQSQRGEVEKLKLAQSTEHENPSNAKPATSEANSWFRMPKLSIPFSFSGLRKRNKDQEKVSAEQAGAEKNSNLSQAR